MIFRIISVALFSLLFMQDVSAQSQQIIPIYNSKDLQNNTLKIYSDSGSLAITAYKPDIIKVSVLSKSDSLKNESAPDLNLRVTQNLDDIFFATDSLWVIVSKLDLSVRFLKKDNEQYLIKNRSYFLAHQKAISFSLNADDQPSLFNGVKEINDANKPSRGRKRWRKPILVSPKGYALFVENPSKGKIRVSTTANHQIKFDSNGAKFETFYFLSGNTDEIKRNLDYLVKGFYPH